MPKDSKPKPVKVVIFFSEDEWEQIKDSALDNDSFPKAWVKATALRAAGWQG